MRAVTEWILIAALVAVPLGAEAIDVTITSPPPGQPLFGEVEFSIDVYPADAVARVEFFLDDELVGEAEDAPYSIQVNVGEENREHRFEVKAYAHWGELAESLLVSPAIDVGLVVEVELQQLYVTVTELDRRVLDLGEDDFTIIDNGALQELITFARGDVRVTAAILIDSSASMRGNRLRYALRGATAFVQGMRPSDNASIQLFSDHLLHKTPMSNNVSVLAAGLDGLHAAGGTALNDHLYLALKQVEHEQGRRVVVILSDGVDTHSALRMHDVIWLARRSRALIYWIRTDPRNEEDSSRFSSWKGPASYRTEYRQLTDVVIESGGRIVTIERIQDAGSAFREILAELREQYVLGYYPSDARNDGRWHRVAVRVTRNGLRVRTRGGYVDY
ncbi:MAG: VWA domain-containing protein [bacterium]|nr:VWA domain-containing protein [bacterium]